jgi:hypothetical protein
MKENQPMADTPKTYTSEGEVAALIADLLAAGKPLEVVVGEERYLLELAAPTRTRPDPETVKRSIAGIKAAAGGWKDLDVDSFLAYIYARRDAVSTRPPVKL